MKQRSGSNSGLTGLFVIFLLAVTFIVATQNQLPSQSSSTTSTTSTTTTLSTTTTTPTTCTESCGTFGSATGIIIPMYVNPTSAQFTEYSQEMIDMKAEYPTVPVVVIVNPDSGVGVYSATVASEVSAMQAAGIYVAGYDWTGYCQWNVPYTPGGNPLVTQADIDNNMSDYASWYHVSAMFFDGMQYQDGGLCAPVYTELTNYASSLGIKYTFGNPGTMTIPQYVGTVTSIFVYEGSYAPTLSTFTGSFIANEPKSNFGYIGFNQPEPSQSYIETASQYVEWIYMTNDNGCSWAGASPLYESNGQTNGCTATSAFPQGVPVNPYTTLPSYLSQEMQDLAAAQ